MSDISDISIEIMSELNNILSDNELSDISDTDIDTYLDLEDFFIVDEIGNEIPAQVDNKNAEIIKGERAELTTTKSKIEH